MKKTLSLLILIVIGSSVFAQKGWNQEYKRKNHFDFFWGYNVEGFSKSDITFVGEDYNFTLYDVEASHRPTAFAADPYFNPAKFTIPQWNMRATYHFANRWSVSVGTDHMKYVMNQNQFAAIEGYIDIPNGQHNGVYNRQQKQLTPDFLKFEHTDGLNYGSIEVEYHGNIYTFNENNSINYYAGPGAGILLPRTNITLMNYPRYDEFHLAGYGVSGKVGVQFVLAKYLILNFESKNGFISMQDILTTGKNPTDRAKQSFWFSEITGTIGVTLDFSKKESK